MSLKIHFTLLAFSGLLFPINAKADFSCRVSPSEYFAMDGAYVLVRVEGKPVKICSFVGNLGDLGADACKVWISHLMTARAQQRDVFLMFHEWQSGGAQSCSQITAWSATPPYLMEAQ